MFTRSSANAACGGLKPPPDRRLRRAKPSSPAEHRFLKVLPIYIQTPIPRSWRTSGSSCAGPSRDLIGKWEATLGVSVPGWSIRRMKTKWGFCNRETRHIWFNLELAKK